MKKNYKIIGLLMIILSILIPCYIKVKEKNKQLMISKQINIYIDKTSKTHDIKSKSNIIKKNEEYDYIAILEIPEINLLQGLVSITNNYNNVEYNIKIIEGSNMPDENNSNLVLASHSGSSHIAYFKNLDKLPIDAEVYIYYQGYKYIYKIDNYYILPKTGEIVIDRDKYKNTITLVTCKKDNDNEQIAYIGYLTDKEIY